MADDDICPECKTAKHFSASIVVVVVFAPALEEPYPLIPAEHYSVCQKCDAMISFVNKAIDAHPTTRIGGDWTQASIVFSDGEAMTLKARRPEIARA